MTEVLLRGTNYRISVHEGLIVFAETDPVYGQKTTFHFERKASCWYFASETEYVMVSHIIAAYEWVVKHKGENFEGVRKPR